MDSTKIKKRYVINFTGNDIYNLCSHVEICGKELFVMVMKTAMRILFMQCEVWTLIKMNVANSNDGNCEKRCDNHSSR
jgi:hypothetical protein